MNLPSGRSLYYYKPRLQLKQDPFGKGRPCLTAIILNTFTRKYERSIVIGALLYQNAVQGVASDFIKHAMLKVREKGVKIIMTVHDEILAEDGTISEQEFNDTMCELPSWGKGMVLATDGYTGTRFRK